MRMSAMCGRQDASRMKFNTAELLALCGKGKCRRDRACSGDPVACFDGKWQALPEEFKMRRAPP
jgi:hypothetical protein